MNKEAVSKGLSTFLQIDSVKEERLCHPTSKFGMGSQDRWFTENVATTVSTEYKRCRSSFWFYPSGFILL